MKQKKCKCGEAYTQYTTLQNACPKCLAKKGRKINEKKAKEAKKAFNKDTKARREALKTRRDYIKDLQVVFNQFIRERDHDQPCISCGAHPKTQDHLRGGAWDCGHYRSVGANPELRFEELNAHRQCKKCNRDQSGNVVNYRNHLKYRIGQEKLEWLEGPHEPLKLSIDEIKELIKDYRERIRILKRSH